MGQDYATLMRERTELCVLSLCGERANITYSEPVPPLTATGSNS